MAALTGYLLRTHQQWPGTAFFGDPANNVAAIRRLGVPELDEAYAELIARSLVKAEGLVSVAMGVGRSTYILTESGKDAVPVLAAER